MARLPIAVKRLPFITCGWFCEVAGHYEQLKSVDSTFSHWLRSPYSKGPDHGQHGVFRGCDNRASPSAQPYRATGLVRQSSSTTGRVPCLKVQPIRLSKPRSHMIQAFPRPGKLAELGADVRRHHQATHGHINTLTCRLGGVAKGSPDRYSPWDLRLLRV